MSEPFTDFERDTETPGVHWEHFVTAVGIWTYVRPDAAPTVADAASAFNTTADLVREAVSDHPWIFCNDDPDPAKQFIEMDGE